MSIFSAAPQRIIASLQSIARIYTIYPAMLVLRDLSRLVTECEEYVQDCFDDHPEIVCAWQKQLADQRRHKSDPSYPLEFKDQVAFVKSLNVGFREPTVIWNKPDGKTDAGDVLQAAPDPQCSATAV